MTDREFFRANDNGKRVHPDFEREQELKKKFYQDFTERELELFDDLRTLINESRVRVEDFVIKRMVERRIIPNVGLFDSGRVNHASLYMLKNVPAYQDIKLCLSNGIIYEMSNEGVSNPNSPYRAVFALEREKNTLFVKVSLPPMDEVIRVIDVWQKAGRMPIRPLREQDEIFSRGEGWDLVPVLEGLVDKAEESISL